MNRENELVSSISLVCLAVQLLVLALSGSHTLIFLRAESGSQCFELVSEEAFPPCLSSQSPRHFMPFRTKRTLS